MSFFLIQGIVLLSAAVIAVPLFRFLGLGAVLGYLVAGILIGPAGLRFVTDVYQIASVSELGVVMLLFLVGLELNPTRLMQMYKPILGTGGSQVVLTSIVIAGICMLAGLPLRSAVVLGMSLSLSSTAIALQILSERNLLATPAGSQAFSTLLLQDMAVIPMLAILPVLSGAAYAPGSANAWAGFFKVALVVVAFVLGGRFLTRPLFRFVAATRTREAFTALALLLVLGSALLMQWVGLSMALGTFLAGVVLADSEYRHELEVDIEPFKGLLLGLFFISVGMGIDFTVFLAHPMLLFGLVLGLVLVKIVIGMGIGALLRLPLSQSVVFALVLSQVGEFAFVMFKTAETTGILTSPEAAVANAVAALSMVTTPLLIAIKERFVDPRFMTTNHHTEPDDIQGVEGGVVIAGFGRFGQVVGRILHSQGFATTVLEHDPSQIELVRRFGYKVFYGDATRKHLLEAAGIGSARLCVVAVDDMNSALAIVHTVKQHFPHVPVLARARNRTHAFELIDAGVDYQIRESLESAIALSSQALTVLGMHPYRAHILAQRFRVHDHQTLVEGLNLRKDDKAVVSHAVQSRELLERLMRSDVEDKKELRDVVWDSGEAERS